MLKTRFGGTWYSTLFGTPYHDESWYQLKHGLQVWAIFAVTVICHVRHTD